MPKIIPDREYTSEEMEEQEQDDEEELETPIQPKKKLRAVIKAEPQIKRRFGIVAPQQLKIVDTETNEVIGDGEYAIIQALTDILERLERIEVKIGTALNE